MALASAARGRLASRPYRIRAAESRIYTAHSRVIVHNATLRASCA
jgi:hypothetical protein